jgi:glycosyltransferase involved in cell wall biosynthesis
MKRRRGSASKQTSATDREDDVISFIIPAYNEEALLGRTLTALREATSGLGEPTEMLVVDDDSADRTPTVAREHDARVVSVRHRQIAATRNAGARAARGEVLVFVDADTVVGREVVRALVDAIRAGAVGGGCAFRFDGPLPWHGRILAGVVVPLYRRLGLASGCFLFCRREAFAAAGGWNEKLFAAEELAMSRALARCGRFVVLDAGVTTSGRKLRAYSGRELLGMLARLVLGMPGSVRTRRGLELWYGDRRADPG